MNRTEAHALLMEAKDLIAHLKGLYTSHDGNNAGVAALVLAHVECLWLALEAIKANQEPWHITSAMVRGARYSCVAMKQLATATNDGELVNAVRVFEDVIADIVDSI